MTTSHTPQGAAGFSPREPAYRTGATGSSPASARLITCCIENPFAVLGRMPLICRTHPLKIIPMTRNIQLLIAYDGTDFHGWQRQQGLRTVQAEIETVAQRVVRHPVDLIASGRTDAGVHAAGQVANFHTECKLPPDKLRHAVGSRLSRDVSLLRVRDVPVGFHAARSATSKLYRYRICNARRGAPSFHVFWKVWGMSTTPPQIHQHRYMYHYHQPLNVDLMRQAAQHFLGAHDFKAMASTRGHDRLSNVRTIRRCDVYTAYEEIRIDVCGTGFLYNQVRNMVGTLIEVGRGRWPPDCIVEILKSRDRQNAGPTAPPHGLCLQWVQYPPDHLISKVDEPQHLDNRKQKVEAVS